MKIKSLEIKGFKSFPDKTVLDFRHGITVVVGPNGCGKSNVMEAIRWVMGEHRARSLRGKKMEDVIFNGSESRKPVGMAEVRLVLANDDGFSHPSMADYDEVMIARRLFREGESQYEINNIPCRLSDVTDFFLDTGVGRNSYAIIEQGRVDMVVASKPEDRRVLLEEAAGINRYKSRREAALKKLEKTNQNLQRINDVVGEVKRQHSSLKRQAAKAERYRKLSEQLRDLDLAQHAFRCRETQQQYNGLHEELEAKRTLLSKAESSSSSIGAQLEKERLKALETEKALKEELETRHKTDLELTSVRARIERNRERILQIDESRQQSEKEKASLENRINEGGVRKDELEASKATVAGDFTHADEELKRALEDSQGIDRELTEQRNRLETLKEDAFRNLQQTAQERNSRESLTRRETEIRRSLERIAGESEELSAALANQRTEREALDAAAAETTELREAAVGKKTELIRNRETTKQRITSLRVDIADREKQLAADKSRLGSLEEMQRDYRGYGQSVRFLMQNRDDPDRKALIGPLAELMEVPPEYEKALAAALGDRLGHVVVSSPREGIDAVNRLKEAEAGRSTFIPLCPRCGPDGGNGDTLDGSPSLKKLVRFREGCESLGDFLLGRYFVVEDINQAVEIWEKNGIQVDLVTTGGDVLNRHGEITGGSHTAAREDLFGKRREISTLRERVALSTETLDDLQARLKEAEELQERLAAEIDTETRSINDLDMKEVRIRKDLERLDAQITTADRRVEVLRLEHDRLAREHEGLSGEFRAAEETIALLERKRADLEREKEETTRRVDELAAVVQTKSALAGEMRVRLATMEERSRSLDKEYRSVIEAIRQLDTQLSALADRAALNEAEQKRLAQDLDHAVVREKELMHEHEAQAGRIEALKNRSAELAITVKNLEHESSTREKEVQELRESVHGLEMESVRLEQMLEGIVDKILDRYRVDPRTIPCPQSPPAESEVADIRGKLESMGEVNLAAIGECNQAEERLTFLLEQEADLKKAVESLYETISKINRTTRERFRSAFDSVNEKFQEIFPFLFRGGEARLELTDEEDLLETGVDIMVRPPGKRKQNMDLLSGGEKALTAVALIFSIFLTRPSPFCLLDEVDAPLDDANLARFNEMLRDLSNRTQFLVITHNKRSMEEADTLYGVTMEEPGVSTVVSVKFMD